MFGLYSSVLPKVPGDIVDRFRLELIMVDRLMMVVYLLHMLISLIGVVFVAYSEISQTVL